MVLLKNKSYKDRRIAGETKYDNNNFKVQPFSLCMFFENSLRGNMQASSLTKLFDKDYHNAIYTSK